MFIIPPPKSYHFSYDIHPDQSPMSEPESTPKPTPPNPEEKEQKYAKTGLWCTGMGLLIYSESLFMQSSESLTYNRVTAYAASVVVGVGVYLLDKAGDIQDERKASQ